MRLCDLTGLLFFSISFSVAGHAADPLALFKERDASPRVEFGVRRLVTALEQAGYQVTINPSQAAANQKAIVIGELYKNPVRRFVEEWRIAINNSNNPQKEGFTLISSGENILVAGADASGVLYGCLELAGRVQAQKKLPASISFTDQPEMILRGTCIGLQKPYYLPGRTVYEYPYTPETFPWFYDRQLWLQVLDSLVENRMNSLYLWNGHPFASLVRLKEYPYAVEVDEATFKKNEEMFRFLATEADRRGIWVIQMFYNIIVSKPFAEHHKIKTQDRERPILPLIADYTRKSIASFVEKYPNVGLMVCLGEAMEGTGNDDIEWFTKTIIPGVKDGLKSLGKTEEPPIVLRAHDTDAPAVMQAALPMYGNLYTEAKFNGEALTFPRPRGKWAELHQTLSKLGSVQIENVHILANLEPFRYGSPDFIQQSVIGMHEVMGGNGLHLYPQASYWDWPYSADSVQGKRLLQIERDWIWYKTWSRYAWKANRDRKEEIIYWSALLAGKFGCGIEEGRKILEAYEESGEIAPKILRRFGITDGNRQTMTLGMLMTQLVNPERFGLFTLLYESESPEGEMLREYAEKEWKKQAHVGETPVQIMEQIRRHGQNAVSAIEAASPKISRNRDEFERLKNDMYCYRALADHYAFKTEAALYALNYKYSNRDSWLDSSLDLLENSVASYKELVGLTKGHYLYANSMQTQQRKIPIRGVDGTFKTWAEVLVPFENELSHFKRTIDSIKQRTFVTTVEIPRLRNAEVKIMDGDYSRFTMDSMVSVFTDTVAQIIRFAEELENLQGLRTSYEDQVKQGTSIRFRSKKPVKLLVGYFSSSDPRFARAPELETNASANDRGQAEAKIANGIVVKGMPPVNIHSYDFPAGTNSLKLPRGACLVLGFIDANTRLRPYDAGLTENEIKKEIDWLFE